MDYWFELVITAICIVSFSIAMYYNGKTKGFIEGYDAGFEVGCATSKFRVLCKPPECDTNNGDDAG